MPCHAHAVLLKATARHSTAVSRQPCCAVALRRTAWSEHGMASVNQTRPHCVNKIGKTHSKLLAARHGRRMGTACYVWIGLKSATYFTDTSGRTCDVKFSSARGSRILLVWTRLLPRAPHSRPNNCMKESPSLGLYTNVSDTAHSNIVFFVRVTMQRSWFHYTKGIGWIAQ